LSDWSAAWALVQPRLASTTRVCSYDRAGLGYSDPSTRPSTSANIVDDLHRLLSAAAIAPPYILVGHSSGSLNVRLYADDYRGEVAGMVLVDPSHEDQAERFDAVSGGQFSRGLPAAIERYRGCLAAAKAGWTPQSAAYRRCIDGPIAQFGPEYNMAHAVVEATATFQAAQLSEFESIHEASAAEVRAARRPYGALPLIVLTASDAPAGTPAALQEPLMQAWRTMHDELAALSTIGVNRVVPNTHHYIEWEQPEAVIGAIREVISTVRSAR